MGVLTSGSALRLCLLALPFLSELLLLGSGRTLSGLSEFEDFTLGNGALREGGFLLTEPDSPPGVSADTPFLSNQTSASARRSRRSRRWKRRVSEGLPPVFVLSRSVSSSVDFGWDAKILVVSTRGPLPESAVISAHKTDTAGKEPGCTDSEVARSASAGSAVVPSFARSNYSMKSVFDPTLERSSRGVVESGVFHPSSSGSSYFYMFSVESLSDREWKERLAFCLRSEEGRVRLLFRAMVPMACLWNAEEGSVVESEICQKKPWFQSVYAGVVRAASPDEEVFLAEELMEEKGFPRLSGLLRVSLLAMPPGELAGSSKAKQLLGQVTRSAILALKKGDIGDKCKGRFDENALAWAGLSSSEAPNISAEADSRAPFLISAADINFEIDLRSASALVEDEPLETLRLCLYTGAADSQPVSVGDVSLKSLLKPPSQTPDSAGSFVQTTWAGQRAKALHNSDSNEKSAGLSFFVCCVVALVVVAAFLAALRLQNQTALESDWTRARGKEGERETERFAPKVVSKSLSALRQKVGKSRADDLSVGGSVECLGVRETQRLDGRHGVKDAFLASSSLRRGSDHDAFNKGFCRDAFDGGATPSRVVYETLWDAQLGRL